LIVYDQRAEFDDFSLAVMYGKAALATAVL